MIKGDQDYGSLLGNDFMRQHSIARVTVLTHCDNLKRTPDDECKLIKTLDQTAENSSLTFAVDGSIKGDMASAEEAKRLALVSQMDPRIEIGALALADHLEERIQAHLYAQYPKALNKLKNCLEATIKRLEELEEKTPADVVYEMAAIILTNFRDSKRGLLNDIRLMLDEMTADIKNHSIRCITVKRRFQLRDEFDEPYEIGQMNYACINPDDKKLKAVIVTHIEGNTVHFVGREDPSLTCTRNACGNACGKWQEQAYSGERDSDDTLVKDIEQQALDRGIRNFVHIDRQPIIQAYAQEFAKHYTKVIHEAKKKVGAHVSKFFDRMFVTGVSETARPAAQWLRTRFAEEEVAISTGADMAIAAIEAHNTDPNLIFSPNEHYLNDLIQRMVSADDHMTEGEAGARHIMHNVRAFIKVQRKYISEMASKELLRTMLSEPETRLVKLLKSRMSEYEKYIQEPGNVIRERSALQNRKKVLEMAVETLLQGDLH